MPAWLLWIGRAVVALAHKPAQVASIVQGAGELARDIDSAIHDEPGQPVTRATENHIRKQIDAATSHKVPHEVCSRPPDGWTCSRQADHDGPCAASPPRIGPWQPDDTRVITVAEGGAEVDELIRSLEPVASPLPPPRPIVKAKARVDREAETPPTSFTPPRPRREPPK